MNEEASVFSDIQQGFSEKELDEVTSGEINLVINIPQSKAIWSTINEVQKWVIANFETSTRKVKVEYKIGYKDKEI